jgi:hypothetical protein
MIRITDPTKLGQTLGTLRATEGWTRVDMARDMAGDGDRAYQSLRLSLWRWDTGKAQPTLDSIGAYLAALGYDLALIPREDTP